MTKPKPTIVIVIEEGIIQEVATTDPKDTLYRVIDLTEGVAQKKGYGDFYIDNTGIDVDSFTKDALT